MRRIGRCRRRIGFLFEEKREVEPDWNEKTGGLCHSVLPSLMPKGRRDILWGCCLNGIRTRHG